MVATKASEIQPGRKSQTKSVACFPIIKISHLIKVIQENIAV